MAAPSVAPGARAPWRRAADVILELLLPSECIGCGKEGTPLCPSCEASLPRLRPPFCRLCAEPVPAGLLCRRCRIEPPQNLASIRAPFLMDGAIRSAIHKLKYDGLHSLVPLLGGFLAEFAREEGFRVDYIVPVPLHKNRERMRGYNQSALLARELSRGTGTPMLEGKLVRVSDTPPQAGAADAGERKRNVERAFAYRGDRLDGLEIALVDDVCTTGSTLEAAALALREAGADRVAALVLAREGHKSYTNRLGR